MKKCYAVNNILFLLFHFLSFPARQRSFYEENQKELAGFWITPWALTSQEHSLASLQHDFLLWPPPLWLIPASSPPASSPRSWHSQVTAADAPSFAPTRILLFFWRSTLRNFGTSTPLKLCRRCKSSFNARSIRRGDPAPSAF